jgi:hypothetical protein
MANIEETRKLMVELMKTLKQPKLIKEGKLTELKLFALIESEDGRFYGKAPNVLIQASNLKAAEKLADEYTNGQYSKYKNGFFHLRPETIKIYK